MQVHPLQAHRSGLSGKKLLKMASMPSMAPAQALKRFEGSPGEHVTVDVPLQPLSSATSSMSPSTLESHLSGRDGATGSICIPEAPAPAVVPAVAAAMATSYFSEFGLDDVPQVI